MGHKASMKCGQNINKKNYCETDIYNDQILKKQVLSFMLTAHLFDFTNIPTNIY